LLSLHNNVEDKERNYDESVGGARNEVEVVGSFGGHCIVLL